MTGSRFGLIDADAAATPLVVVEETACRAWLEAGSAFVAQWVAATRFTAKADAFCFIPDDGNGVPGVLAVVETLDSPWVLSSLAERLPAGRYRLDASFPEGAATAAALSWALAAYRFERYRSSAAPRAELVWPAGADRAEVERLAEAMGLARDLVNTPAEDLGPAELAEAARAVARDFGADIRLIVGEDLLAENYPTIHAVGRASPRAPRLIDVRWGAETAPRLTLVGKGVCFDSGGLDLKSREAMRGMNRDMGGAAVVLGLGRALMAAQTPVRLRILIPAVDNAVSGGAMRPLDVVRTRSGKTVEIGDTDAEGRLILCDALTEAESEQPHLLIDCATLTGAARIALGRDVQALFCEDDALAAELVAASIRVDDPVWRLPLWRPYRRLLESRIADINNLADTPHGGAITAAVFLADFVARERRWVHLDITDANAGARPGRPEGGEAAGLRALYTWLRDRYR